MEHARAQESLSHALCARPRRKWSSQRLGLLRQDHQTGRPRVRRRDRQGDIRNLTAIDLRPPEVPVCIVPAHGEGDATEGADHHAPAGTLAERLGRDGVLVKLDGATAHDAPLAANSARDPSQNRSARR